MSMREAIIKLYNEGITYIEIARKLNCSKSNVTYHCKKLNLVNANKRKFIELPETEIANLIEYGKTHTIKQCEIKFGISEWHVRKYVKRRDEIMTAVQSRKKNYDRVLARRQQHKLKAIEYKGGKCQICGYSKSPWALTFHHTDPSEKSFTIAKYTTFKWERIQEELDKCLLLCQNCHAEIHHKAYNISLL